jgi:predicted phage terminase large subunit-like protein
LVQKWTSVRPFPFQGDKLGKVVGTSEEQLKEIRTQCQESLWFLCTAMLGYPDWDTCHDDMERLLRKPSRRKANVFPRNHLKSTFGTVAYSIQHILKNPNVRILIANQVWDMSRSFLREIKEQLQNSQLKYLFGEFVSAKWNEDEVIVRQRTKPLKEPTIKTAGIESEQTGGHFDVIILDDLMGLQNSQTPEQREKAKRFRRSMINLLEPGGVVVENLTRWHLDDTFADVLEKELRYYDVMVRQVYEKDKEGRHKLIFPKKFAKKFDAAKKDWISIDDPYCLDYVDFLKTSMPLDEFSAQYLNQPFSSENQLFKPEMFKYWRQKPEGMYVAMCIDLAISEKAQADETAIKVAGMDSEYNLYALDYLKGRWKPADIINNVFQMRDRWKPHTVGMETNGFQRTLKLACEDEMRKRRSYFPIEEIKTGPQASKEERIKSLEPFYRRGNVFHANWMKGKDLEIQLQTFPKGRHDDLIDAFSMCLPLLHPGSKPIQQTEDDWDRAMRQARQYSRPFQGFFDHGR